MTRSSWVKLAVLVGVLAVVTYLNLAGVIT